MFLFPGVHPEITQLVVFYRNTGITNFDADAGLLFLVKLIPHDNGNDSERNNCNIKNVSIHDLRPFISRNGDLQLANWEISQCANIFYFPLIVSFILPTAF